MDDSRRAWLLRAGGALLLAALIGFLVWRGQLDPGKILTILGAANPVLVGLSVVIYFPFVGLKSERWRLLARDLGIGMRPGEAWRLYAVGLGAGVFTPGQAGDLVKAWTLQRRGHRLSAAIASSVLDRIWDVAGLAVLAALGVWVFGRAVVGDLGAIVLLGAGAILAAGAFARRDWLLARLRRARVGSGPSLRSGWAVGSDEGSGVRDQGLGVGDQVSVDSADNSELKTLPWQGQNLPLAGSKLPTPNPQPLTPTRHWAWVAGLTAASFVVSVFRVWLLAVAIGLPLDPATVGGLTGLTTVAALIPISVSGVGTRDTAMVALLAQLGRPAAEAVALSTLILVLNIANAGFGYAIWWVESRLDRKPAPAPSP